MVAAVVRGGPVFTNGLSALFGCVAVLFFALSLRRLGVRAYLLPSLLLAFVPVVYVNCTSTIDYIPALAFLLAATYFAIAGRPLVSGILLGFAIGTRITSGAMLLPLAVWVALENTQGRRVRDIAILTVAALTTGFLVFLPAMFRYGTAFFAFADWTVYPELDKVFLLGVRGVWGYSAGTVAAVALLLFSLGGFFALTTTTTRASKHAVLVSSIVVILYLVAYLRAPFEAGYLIPLVPFVLLMLCLLYPPAYLRVVSVALLPAFLLAPGELDPARPAAILHDHRIRQERQLQTTRIIEKVNTLPEKTIIVAAWERPQILANLSRAEQEKHIYIYFITSNEQMREYQALGHAVYFLEGLDYHNLQTHQVDLVKLGAQPLFPPDSTAQAGHAP